MHGGRDSTAPHRSLENGESERVDALKFITPATQQLGYGDNFEDTPSECHFFACEPTELEDSGDEDWVPTSENTRSYSILKSPEPTSHVQKPAFLGSKMGQGPNKMASRSRSEYRQAILGSSSKPRTSFTQKNGEATGVSNQSQKANQHQNTSWVSRITKKTFDSDGGSDVEVTSVTPHRGRSAEDPFDISSGGETPTASASEGAKLKRQTTSTQRSANPRDKRAVACVGFGTPYHLTVDLTMLPTSDSSGSSSDESFTDETPDDESEGVICISDSNPMRLQLEAANNQHGGPRSTATQDGKLTDESSDSDDESQSSKVEQAPASDEGTTHAADSDLEIPELEMFHSHEAPTTFSLKREEELAGARDESARLEHEAANHQRWLNGEPYVPFPEPAAKRELGLADENHGRLKLKQHRLSKVAWEAIRACARDGISPFFIRRRDRESDVCFAARLLSFKESGWKKRIGTRGRRRVRRERVMRAALICASKRKDEIPGKERLGRSHKQISVPR